MLAGVECVPNGPPTELAEQRHQQAKDDQCPDGEVRTKLGNVFQAAAGIGRTQIVRVMVGSVRCVLAMSRLVRHHLRALTVRWLFAPHDRGTPEQKRCAGHHARRVRVEKLYASRMSTRSYLPEEIRLARDIDHGRQPRFLTKADKECEEGETFNQSRRDNHGGLNVAGSLGLTSHPVQGGTGQFADAEGRTHDGQAHAEELGKVDQRYDRFGLLSTGSTSHGQDGHNSE